MAIFGVLKIHKPLIFFKGTGGGSISAPANLVATGSSSSIGLTWDAVVSATSYKIYRGLHGGPLSFLNTSGTNSFTDSTAVSDTIYDYYVTAVNGALESASSNIASAYLVLRTGRLLQTFYGQAAQSWSEVIAITQQTSGLSDYLLTGGTCDFTGNYTGGVDTFTGANFDWTFNRYTIAGALDTSVMTYGQWRISHGGDDDELYSIVVLPSGKILISGMSYQSSDNTQALCIMRLNSDFTLDQEFGTMGTVRLFDGSHYRYQNAVMTVQSTGKIITCTELIAAPGNSLIRVTRLHSNGSLDLTFGPGSHPGHFYFQPNTRDTTGSQYCGKVFVDSNDKIIISSERHDLNGDGSAYVGLVARILSDGTATDTTFGTNMGDGTYASALSFSLSNGGINAITPTPSGGYLACGSASTTDSAVKKAYTALLTSSGTLDTTFNTTGKLEALYGSLASSYFIQPLALSSGKFRLFGLSSSLNEIVPNTVSPITKYLGVGYNSTGTLDTTFGTSGVFEQAGNNMALFFDLFEAADGDLYLGGHQAYPPSSGIAQATILKMLDNGTVDPFFGDLITPPTPPTAPTVTTGAASSVTSTSASIAGTVNPHGVSTTFHVEYGLNTNYGLRTAETTVGSQSSAQNVSANLTGLLPGSTYHYRVIAYNGTIGTDGDATFTTSSGTYTAFYDTFTNTNGTGMVNHTGYADIDYTGAAYVQDAGIGQIQSNKATWAYLDAPMYNGSWFIRRDLGTKNVNASAIVTWNGGIEGHNLIEGIFVQGNGINKWIGAGFTYLGGGAFAILQNDNGTVTLLDSFVMSAVSGTPYTITLSSINNNITATITGGSRTLSGIVSATSFTSSNTQIGWYLCKGVGDTVENFQADIVMDTYYRKTNDSSIRATDGGNRRVYVS